MMYLKIVLVSLLAMFFLGCTGSPSVENMVYTTSAAEASHYDRHLQEAVTVASVSGGAESSFFTGSDLSNEEFSEALKQSFAKLGMLSETGRYKLMVELLDIDKPLFGFDMTVTTKVRYALIDSKTDKVIFDQTLVKAHTKTIGDAFVGATRLLLALEASAKDNIQGLFEKLRALRINPKDISFINR